MAKTPSAEFNRWADRFDSRHRFGIPVGPTNTRSVADMPPTIVELPPRAGSMRFTDEDVTAVIELLRQCETGQAVRLTDTPDDSDNTARRRAELLKEQMDERLKEEKIKEGFKVRGHVLTAGDPTVKEHTSKKSGKTYKVTSYPENWAAVSLVPENTPDEPEPEEPGEDDHQPTQPADRDDDGQPRSSRRGRRQG